MNETRVAQFIEFSVVGSRANFRKKTKLIHLKILAKLNPCGEISLIMGNYTL